MMAVLERYWNGKVPVFSPSATGTRLGTTVTGDQVVIEDRDRDRHVYIIGATGTGKSTLIANMVRQDIEAGYGVILIDAHGDLFDDVRKIVGRKEVSDAVLADVSDVENPFSMNILEAESPTAALERNFICNHLIRLFSRVLYRGVPEAFGPIFESYFRNALMLLLEGGGPAVTLADFDRVFCDSNYRRQLLDACNDPLVKRFWTDIAVRVTRDEFSLTNITPYIVSKINQFVGNPLVRPIITQPGSSLNFWNIMQEGRVCLVNLAKGMAGEYDTALLGALITAKMFSVALARGALPREERRPVRVYLDEFQIYATDILADMLAESRKFGLQCVLANQSLGQVDGRAFRADLAHAILANAATVLSFRVGPQDATWLAPWFEPNIGAAQLNRLRDHEAAARLLAEGRPIPAFTFETDPPLDQE